MTHPAMGVWCFDLDFTANVVVATVTGFAGVGNQIIHTSNFPGAPDACVSPNPADAAAYIVLPDDADRPAVLHRVQLGLTARRARCFGSALSGHHQHVGNYTKTNLRADVENQAPKFDMPSEMQARFARTPMGGETLGLSLFTLAPNFRIPFGHKHSEQEEVYVIVRGSGRIKVEDEIVDVAEWDAIRFDTNSMRCVEAGADGIEYVAFGAGEDPMDAEMTPNWWSD